MHKLLITILSLTSATSYAAIELPELCTSSRSNELAQLQAINQFCATVNDSITQKKLDDYQSLFTNVCDQKHNSVGPDFNSVKALTKQLELETKKLATGDLPNSKKSLCDSKAAGFNTKTNVLNKYMSDKAKEIASQPVQVKPVATNFTTGTLQDPNIPYGYRATCGYLIEHLNSTAMLYQDAFYGRIPLAFVDKTVLSGLPTKDMNIPYPTHMIYQADKTIKNIVFKDKKFPDTLKYYIGNIETQCLKDIKVYDEKLIKEHSNHNYSKD